MSVETKRALLAESKRSGQAGRAFARLGRLQARGLWVFTEDGWLCHECGKAFVWKKAAMFSPSWILRHFNSAHRNA